MTVKDPNSLRLTILDQGTALERKKLIDGLDELTKSYATLIFLLEKLEIVE